MDDKQKEQLKQNEANQAPPVNTPTYVDNAVKDIREDVKKTTVSIAEIESRALAEGSQTEFWEIVKKRLRNTVDAMRRAESTRMGQGNLDLQSVGLRSIIINEIADFADDLINTVEFSGRKQIVSNNESDEDVPDTVGLEEIEKQ